MKKLLSLVLLLACVPAMAETKSFPFAYGHGRATVGARNASAIVMFITTLHDDYTGAGGKYCNPGDADGTDGGSVPDGGTQAANWQDANACDSGGDSDCTDGAGTCITGALGSFRRAWSATAYRYIIPLVSGEFQPSANVNSESNATYLGHLAPADASTGGGIVQGRKSFQISTDDSEYVIRYMKIRSGNFDDTAGKDIDTHGDSFGISGNASDVIVDHSGITGGYDEVLSVGPNTDSIRTAVNYTFQRNTIGAASRPLGACTNNDSTCNDHADCGAGTNCDYDQVGGGLGIIMLQPEVSFWANATGLGGARQPAFQGSIGSPSHWVNNFTGLAVARFAESGQTNATFFGDGAYPMNINIVNNWFRPGYEFGSANETIGQLRGNKNCCESGQVVDSVCMKWHKVRLDTPCANDAECNSEHAGDTCVPQNFYMTNNVLDPYPAADGNCVSSVCVGGANDGSACSPDASPSPEDCAAGFCNNVGEDRAQPCSLDSDCEGAGSCLVGPCPVFGDGCDGSTGWEASVANATVQSATAHSWDGPTWDVADVPDNLVDFPTHIQGDTATRDAGPNFPVEDVKTKRFLDALKQDGTYNTNGWLCSWTAKSGETASFIMDGAGSDASGDQWIGDVDALINDCRGGGLGQKDPFFVGDEEGGGLCIVGGAACTCDPTALIDTDGSSDFDGTCDSADCSGQCQMNGAGGVAWQADDDEDGMPDAWEATQSGCPAGDCDPNATDECTGWTSNDVSDDTAYPCIEVYAYGEVLGEMTEAGSGGVVGGTITGGSVN